jgi:8-oxo-dGTP diphosphatase
MTRRFLWKVETNTLERMHVLARGVIFRGSEILVAKATGQAHTFLPGGHLEPGESLVNALVREVAEELGLPCNVESYLGAIEFQWPENCPTDYEINHIFLATIDDKSDVTARESHLTFTWTGVDLLDSVRLEPKPLRALIRQFTSGERSAWWATNLTQ